MILYFLLKNSLPLPPSRSVSTFSFLREGPMAVLRGSCGLFVCSLPVAWALTGDSCPLSQQPAQVGQERSQGSLQGAEVERVSQVLALWLVGPRFLPLSLACNGNRFSPFFFFFLLYLLKCICSTLSALLISSPLGEKLNGKENHLLTKSLCIAFGVVLGTLHTVFHVTLWGVGNLKKSCEAK